QTGLDGCRMSMSFSIVNRPLADDSVCRADRFNPTAMRTLKAISRRTRFMISSRNGLGWNFSFHVAALRSQKANMKQLKMNSAVERNWEMRERRIPLLG